MKASLLSRADEENRKNAAALFLSLKLFMAFLFSSRDLQHSRIPALIERNVSHTHTPHLIIDVSQKRGPVKAAKKSFSLNHLFILDLVTNFLNSSTYGRLKTHIIVSFGKRQSSTAYTTVCHFQSSKDTAPCLPGNLDS